MNYLEWSSRVDELFRRGLVDGRIWREDSVFEAFNNLYRLAEEEGLEVFAPQIHQGPCLRRTPAQDYFNKFYSREVSDEFVAALKKFEIAGI